MVKSPYYGKAQDQWHQITLGLIEEHPLCRDQLVDAVLSAWQDIFNTKIGKAGVKIGIDIFPKPQIMSFLLHELIGFELERQFPKDWRHESSGADKDVVYIPNPRYSFEIKASSSRGGIFGNRSYAQEASDSKKSKSGYYLTVNFDKFNPDSGQPRVRMIRFGWLDQSDWRGQKAPTGQQANLSRVVINNKFAVLFAVKD